MEYVCELTIQRCWNLGHTYGCSHGSGSIEITLLFFFARETSDPEDDVDERTARVNAVANDSRDSFNSAYCSRLNIASLIFLTSLALSPLIFVHPVLFMQLANVICKGGRSNLLMVTNTGKAQRALMLFKLILKIISPGTARGWPFMSETCQLY